MICSIHQPNYVPYIGLFQKIYKSDIFIFYDTAQYTKGDYHNRNAIKGPNGKILLTIPVSISLGDSIKEVSFNKAAVKKHLKTIEQAYKKSQYFDDVFSLLSEIYSYDSTDLADFNINSTKKICEYMGITTKIFTLSESGFILESRNTQALIDICNYYNASEYISGLGGKGYIDVSKFEDADIKLSFQEFTPTQYSQLWGDFIPYLSVIDLLFSQGRDSINFL